MNEISNKFKKSSDWAEAYRAYYKAVKLNDGKDEIYASNWVSDYHDAQALTCKQVLREHRSCWRRV